ncbi:MAG TPA: hypothetical protein PLD65_11795, partial [Solirubrobacterales bacterium]|nr:hypothetical protein [Solirubrobacterales bacterium]
DPGNPGSDDPGTDDPGTTTDDPGTEDPDTPVSDDPTGDDSDNPSSDDPVEDLTDDEAAQSGGPKSNAGMAKAIRAQKRRVAAKKCQKIGKRSKRKACLKRARSI